MTSVRFGGNFVDPDRCFDGLALSKEKPLVELPFGVHEPEIKQLLCHPGRHREGVSRISPLAYFCPNQVYQVTSILFHEIIHFKEVALRALSDRDGLNVGSEDAPAFPDIVIIQIAVRVSGVMFLGFFVGIVQNRILFFHEFSKIVNELAHHNKFREILKRKKSSGCFYGNRGMFRVVPPLQLKRLEAIFRHRVFTMLLAKGKITKEMIAMLSTWRHSGFHVFCGNRISPDEETAMENLARYIIRSSFSQERMQSGKGGHPLHRFHEHQHPSPYLVAIISLTYKAVFVIFPPQKRKFLSKNIKQKFHIGHGK